MQNGQKHGVMLRTKQKIGGLPEGEQLLLGSIRWQPSGVYAPALFRRSDRDGRWVIHRPPLNDGEGKWDHEPTTHELEIFTDFWLRTPNGQYYDRVSQ